MKKNRLIPVLVLALSSGLLAWYLAVNYLHMQATPLIAAEARTKAKLAVAARDLPVGAVIRAEDVRLLDWHADVLPPGHASSTAELVGRGLLSPMRENEAFLDGKLAEKDSGGGLPIVIPEGMRAVSVKVDEVIGVAGFVRPETRVDVLVTLTQRGQIELPITRQILQNIRVLSSGQEYQKDEEGKPQVTTAITLLVTPQEGERLTLAANEGRIQLALRNTLDMGAVNTPGIRLNALVEAPRPTTGSGRAVQVQSRARGPAGQAGNVVETFRGGVRTIQTF